MPNSAKTQCIMHGVVFLTLSAFISGISGVCSTNSLAHESALYADGTKDCEEEDDVSSLLQIETSAMGSMKRFKGAAAVEADGEENSLLQTLVQPSLHSLGLETHSKSQGRRMPQDTHEHESRMMEPGEPSETGVAPVFFQTGEEVGHANVKNRGESEHTGRRHHTHHEGSSSSMPTLSPQVSSRSSDAMQAWDAWFRSLKLTIVLMLLVIVIAWAIGRRIRSHLHTPGVVRENVQKLPVLPWREIEGLVARTETSPIPACMRYQYLCRLEARIEGPADSSQTALDAPLAQRDCVVFSVMVSSPNDDGGLAEAIAFKSKAIDFLASPLDSPETRIRVCGSDVSLFDIRLGFTSAMKTLANAPSHWQDFVQTYKASHLSSDDVELKFEESALLVGSIITLVGEPQLGVDGILSFVPRQIEYRDDIFTGSPVAMPSTSRAPAGPQVEAVAVLEVLAAKVLASDDAELLHFWKPMKRRLRAAWKSLFPSSQPDMNLATNFNKEHNTYPAPDVPAQANTCSDATLVPETTLPQKSAPELGTEGDDATTMNIPNTHSKSLAFCGERAGEAHLMIPVPAG